MSGSRFSLMASSCNLLTVFVNSMYLSLKIAGANLGSSAKRLKYSDKISEICLFVWAEFEAFVRAFETSDLSTKFLVT